MRTHVPVPIILQRCMQFLEKHKVNFIGVLMGLVGVVLAFCLVMMIIVTPIQHAEALDKGCRQAYGQEWDWQNRQIENDGNTEIPGGRIVCISTITKEERPVK